MSTSGYPSQPQPTRGYPQGLTSDRHLGFNPFSRSPSAGPPPGGYEPPSAADAKAARKAEKHRRKHSLKETRAEMKIAMGLETLYTEYRKKEVRGVGGEAGGGGLLQMAEGLLDGAVQGSASRQRSKSKSRNRGGEQQVQQNPAAGLIEVAEGFLAKELDQRRRSRLRANSVSPSPEEQDQGRTIAKEVMGAAGAAVLGGGVGLGSTYLMNKVDPAPQQQRREPTPTPAPVPEDLARASPRSSSRSRSRRRDVEKEIAGAAGAAVLGGVVGLGSMYLMNKADPGDPRRKSAPAADEPRRPSSRSSSVSRSQSRSPYPMYANTAPPPSIPRSLPPPRQGRAKVFMSELSKTEHYLVQHSAASLLLKEPEIMSVVGSFNGMVNLVSQGSSRAHGGYNEELFGVSLKTLLKYESTQSHHGIGPGTIKIPTFIDHCITALMQMDMTIEGILRVPGNQHLIKEIVNALNHPGGQGGYTVDLAAIDPLTLGSIFKKFLADLPDPVLTSHLFHLFLAASHIKNVAVRKRAMHLVVCMMPKANRDVMEVVFLFLDWLSTYAHINVKVGNRMDLSNIATVMAPTLLRPSSRDPHPAEVPAMIAAVLTLLEDQHILHEIPFELAKALHIPLPPEKDSHSLLSRLSHIF
ncbi:hypothetical protein MNV49_003213 [Pseudohyphozyma bogoriensis]|nr:hypothetical protein MNV49_003213 [Pseudohyphozyma bogoriensis]